MINKLQSDFIVNKENNTITIRREFNAELHLVWDAFTKKEILDTWWAPKPWKAKTKKLDFSEGGEWLYAMVGPNGEEHWALAHFTKIEQHKFYTGKDAFADENGNINTELPQSLWKVSFKENGKTTLVELFITYADLEQLEATIQMGFKEGITMTLDSLHELLDNLKK